jgi:MFS family permease
MIEAFHVPTESIAKWAGLSSAIFSVCQSISAIPWSRISDRVGRKPTILTGLICLMISTTFFGFSTSLGQVIVTRAFAGFANGDIGVMKTVVAELVPQRDLQPRAFVVLPLVWTVGSILGPILGGFLVFPQEDSNTPSSRSKLLSRFPFALPNLVTSILFFVGFLVGLLFLEETSDQFRNRKDFGLLLGSYLKSPFKRQKHQEIRFHLSEAESFIQDSSSMEMSELCLQDDKKGTQSHHIDWAKIFSSNSTINLITIAFLAMHSIWFDQLLPVFMHHPVQTLEDPTTRLPFHFTGGFGMDAPEIGFLFMVYAVSGMIIQFTVFPIFASRYGVICCMKICSIAFPIVYFLTPFTSMIPYSPLRQFSMLILMLIKGWASMSAFPSSIILLTRSAADSNVLGTLNGVSASFSAMGRAIGPMIGGFTFTYGIVRDCIVLPWWILAIVAVLAAIPVYWIEDVEETSMCDEDTTINEA